MPTFCDWPQAPRGLTRLPRIFGALCRKFAGSPVCPRSPNHVPEPGSLSSDPAGPRNSRGASPRLSASSAFLGVDSHPSPSASLSPRLRVSASNTQPVQSRLPHGRERSPSPRPTRGSALLMVLWISAALAAISFSLANTVRGETERASTVLDEVRGYYLATGAVDRAAVELLWIVSMQGERKIKEGAAWVDYTFPTGVAHVELIPETAKLDVNNVPPDQLMRLVTALGVEPGQAMQVTQGIVARRGGGGAALSPSPGPSFPGPAASLKEVEELLSVPGIIPAIFYGTD